MIFNNDQKYSIDPRHCKKGRVESCGHGVVLAILASSKIPRPSLLPPLPLRKTSGLHAALLAYYLGTCNRCFYSSLYSSVHAAPAMLAIFLMGAWTSRSAGCIINDYFDRNFDRSVERCKDRPLASGEVTVREAAGLLFLNLCGGLYVLTQLPLPALIATFAILPVAALYPLAKRYTRYPQFILGLAFNSGVIIGALTLSP